MIWYTRLQRIRSVSRRRRSQLDASARRSQPDATHVQANSVRCRQYDASQHGDLGPRGSARGAPRHPLRRLYRATPPAIAPGYVQANICILPRDLAEDFLLYCQRNPKPCPLIARSDLAIRGCRRWPKISISAPIFRAITFSATANSPRK